MTRAALAGIAGFALAYLAAGALQLPVLLYDPGPGAATVSRTVTGMSMRYFGDLLLAGLAGVGTGLAFHSRAATPLRLPAAAALFAVALDAIYYLSQLLVPL